MLSDDIYMLWLSRIEGIGLKKIYTLLHYFKTAEGVFLASADDLIELAGMTKASAQSIISSKDERKLEQWMIELKRKNIQFMSFYNPKYPYLLKNIYDPPAGIYIKGELPEDDMEKVSVIGSRRCTSYGAEMGFRIARDLAREDIVIVSGMARGIDSVAHKGALEGGGFTIAVFGCGVDVCYPVENEKLMNKIIQNGCVISEYPPGTKPNAGHFPVRNRIISGLSKILIVVEAAKRSGTIITVDQALDNGRDVFVVPGPVTSPNSEGIHELIKQGCPIITCSDDILFELGITPNEDKNMNNLKNDISGLAKEQKSVYDCISLNPVSADEIAVKLDWDIQKVQYILTILEIMGHIKKRPQSGYVRGN